jgi:hypothetical protein
MSSGFTIIDDDRKTEVDARIDGEHVLVSPGDLERALGWTLEDTGLCRDDVCIPLPPASGIVRDGAIDLAVLAATLDRPLACDLDARAAAIGESARDRAAAMRGRRAPDFTLPDLSGRTHSLGDYRGRKALLLAWASW